MSKSHNLQLPFLEAAQAQKHVTVNEALRRIDAVAQLTVKDRVSTPPSEPQEGDRYIVAANAAAAWQGRETYVAAYIDGGWEFFLPRAGWLAFVEAGNMLVYFVDGAWEIFVTADGGDHVATLGINATATAEQRLFVQSRAAVFAHDLGQSESGNVQLFASKATEADTASHVFQDNYVGHAELGLIGANDFSLKVSPNGQDFVEAFTVDRTSGRVDFASVPSVNGVDGFLATVPTLAALAQSSLPDDVKTVETRGYRLENDGGGGRYHRTDENVADGVGTVDADGNVWVLSGNTVTARQAGAVGDGLADDTEALQRALMSGRTVLLGVGQFLVSDALATGHDAQRIAGEGRGLSIIVVPRSFSPSARGVIDVQHSRVALEEFEVGFDQSGTANREELIAYPPVIHVQDRTHCRFAGLRFSRAYDGVRAGGDCDGVVISDIECGTFNKGLDLSEARGSVGLHNVRVQPFGFAQDPELFATFADGPTTAFDIGPVDDLRAFDCAASHARIVLRGADGRRPSGTISGLSLDGPRAGIDMRDGDVSLAALFATASEGAVIHQTGGQLRLSGFRIAGGPEASSTLVLVDGHDARCQAQNGHCTLGSDVASEGFCATAGRLSVSSVRFFVGATEGREGACIRQKDGEVIAFGNTVEVLENGSGKFIVVDRDGEHLVFGNDSAGFAYEFPAVRNRGTYGPNHHGGAVVFNNALSFGPTDDTDGGGEVSLLGAGMNGDVGLANNAGNARFSVGDGKLLEVLAGDDAARLDGSRLAFANLSGNTFVGQNAGSPLGYGSNNTAIGREATFSTSGAISNSTAVGYQAFADAPNQVQLGNNATTTYVHALVQRSDARDKTDVRDTTLGLDFIKALRPVDFRWDYREDYERPQDAASDWSPPSPGSQRRTRFHHGFLAQDIAEVINATGIDFGGFKDHAVSGGGDIKSVGYTELIAPVVKAIQQLNERLEAIEARLGS